MKVNTKTLTATREGIPMPLIGLSEDTLRNLQTALNPVPTEFKDIEYWDESDKTLPFDSATHTLDGTETLTVDVPTKTVKVTKGIRAKTVVELDAELLSAKSVKLEQLRKKFQETIDSKPRVSTSMGYDVDGGRDNKDDFFSKCESMADTDVTTVRDADNQFHPNTTKAQMQTIYRAIIANGEALLGWKWQKEIEIASCTTLAELDAVVF